MPLAAERPYTYAPLIDPLAIRFVILHPGAFSNPVEINIIQTTLARKRPYEALSYTWGDERSLKPIAIHGQKRRVVHVTENLEAALRQLRKPKGQRILWIDAICIYVDRYQREYHRNLRFGPVF